MRKLECQETSEQLEVKLSDSSGMEDIYDIYTESQIVVLKNNISVYKLTHGWVNELNGCYQNMV